MSGADRDPIFEGLDRLAGLADREVAGDRMPDIRRRVRVARQRRVAAVGVAAVAAVAVGLGVWRVLPVDDKPQPAPQPPAGISQTIHPQVTSVAPGVLDIRVIITGRSSAYTDASGRPVAAGPAAVRLSVDGQEVSGIPASKDASCEPGGEVSTYVARFPTGSASSVFAVPVEGAGEHRVEVRASYCADGEVLESVTTLLATTDTAFDVVDETRADLDGDGADESIQLLMPPAGTDADQQVRVTWADGVAQAEPLPNTMLRAFEEPVDLNSDGRPEVVVSGSGGEAVEYAVFHVAEGTGSLVPVFNPNGSGDSVVMGSGVAEGQPLDEAWQLVYEPGQFLSWRAREPFPTRPAAVDVRLWDVGPSVFMTEQKKVRTGCWHEDFSITLGPC